MKTFIISTADYIGFASRVGVHALAQPQANATNVIVHRETFPDGEIYLRTELSMRGAHAVIVGGTNTDRNLVEIYSLAHQAVRDGARRLSLVIPYFGYSTMERARHPGEVIMAKTCATLLSSIPNPPDGKHVFMMDLHTDGILGFFEGAVNAVHLYAKDQIQAAVKKLVGDERIVVGSADSGRVQWVESYARDMNADVVFITKRRTSGSTTEVVAMSGCDVNGRVVFLYDDMIRSGSTTANAVKAYLKAGATKVIVGASHLPLCADNDLGVITKIFDAGASAIIATNSHPRGVRAKNALDTYRGAFPERKLPHFELLDVAGEFAKAVLLGGRTDMTLP